MGFRDVDLRGYEPISLEGPGGNGSQERRQSVSPCRGRTGCPQGSKVRPLLTVALGKGSSNPSDPVFHEIMEIWIFMGIVPILSVGNLFK